MNQNQNQCMENSEDIFGVKNLTPLTKELIFYKILEIHSEIDHLFISLGCDETKDFHQLHRIEIDLLEMQSSFLKSKLFN